MHLHDHLYTSFVCTVCGDNICMYLWWWHMGGGGNNTVFVHWTKRFYSLYNVPNFTGHSIDYQCFFYHHLLGRWCQFWALCGINHLQNAHFSIIFLRKLFWTDIGSHPAVESASLKGKDRVVIASTNLVSPSGLTVDFTDDRLFWCDQRRGLVETAALDGSDRQVLLENHVGEACVTHACTALKRNKWKCPLFSTAVFC